MEWSCRVKFTMGGMRNYRPEFFFIFMVLNVVRGTGRNRHACVCTRRPAGRKTRVGTLTKDSCVSGEIIANFWIVVFSRERCQIEGTERLDMEAPWKSLCRAVSASLWRQPSLCGNDTHAVVARHGMHTKCGPMHRWVASLAHRLV